MVGGIKHIDSSLRKDKRHFQHKSLLGSQNSAQKVLDGVTSISNVVASVGSQPTKMISDWVTDQIAPSYWITNNEIQVIFYSVFKSEKKLVNIV